MALVRGCADPPIYGGGHFDDQPVDPSSATSQQYYPYITRKNTFLHVEERPTTNTTRAKSAPPPAGCGDGGARLTGVETPTLRLWESEERACGKEDLEDEDEGEDVEDESGSAEWTETGASSNSPARTGRRRAKRPCKTKRLRYRKLVTRLTEEMTEDPGHFDFDRAELPPSVAADEMLRGKLQRRLMRMQQQPPPGANVAPPGAYSASSWEALGFPPADVFSLGRSTPLPHAGGGGAEPARAARRTW